MIDRSHIVAGVIVPAIAAASIRTLEIKAWRSKCCKYNSAKLAINRGTGLPETVVYFGVAAGLDYRARIDQWLAMATGVAGAADDNWLLLRDTCVTVSKRDCADNAAP